MSSRKTYMKTNKSRTQLIIPGVTQSEQVQAPGIDLYREERERLLLRNLLHQTQTLVEKNSGHPSAPPSNHVTKLADSEVYPALSHLSSRSVTTSSEVLLYRPSSLKRPKRLDFNDAPAAPKVPRSSLEILSNHGHADNQLLSINNENLYKVTSMDEMSMVLSAKGLSSPSTSRVADCHDSVRSDTLYTEESLSNLASVARNGHASLPKPVRSEMFYQEQSFSATNLPLESQYRPTVNINRTQHLPQVSTLERGASLSWKQYGIGQVSYNPRPVVNVRLPANATIAGNTRLLHNDTLYKFVPAVAASCLYRPYPQSVTHQIHQNHTSAAPVSVHMLNGHNCFVNPGRLNSENQTTVNTNLITENQSTSCAVVNPGIPLKETKYDNSLENILTEAEIKSESDGCVDLGHVGEADLATLDNEIAARVGALLEQPVRMPDENVFELSDKLKNIKPYVISGWISSTYLLALMQKTNLVGEMFDNALDRVGDICPDVLKTCRKTTPAILARDLVFRVFTLGELNGLKFRMLSRNKMGAIRRCVKRQFPASMTRHTWKDKCLPQIKASLTTLFTRRVKQVQDFWLSSLLEQV